MQLRDFKEEIESPGQWGFFAGKIEEEESAEQTIWREIKEELCWQPKSFDFLGNLNFGNRRMHIFYCDLFDDINTLSLQEGEEIGIFLPKEINENKLYSNKMNSYFPISEISHRVFDKFYKDLLKEKSNEYLDLQRKLAS